MAVLNIAYFGVEFAVARSIGSVSLFADSIDFLEDAAVNFLILVALDWTAPRRAWIGMALADILLVSSLATLWTAGSKLNAPLPPAARPLLLAGAGALVVNLACAIIFARFRQHSGSLTRAAFLSARNDAFANVAIITAGIITAYRKRGTLARRTIDHVKFRKRFGVYFGAQPVSVGKFPTNLPRAAQYSISLVYKKHHDPAKLLGARHRETKCMLAVQKREAFIVAMKIAAHFSLEARIHPAPQIARAIYQQIIESKVLVGDDCS